MNILDLVTFKNNDKYVIVSILKMQKRTYYYLVNLKTKKDIKICYFNKNILEESNNKEINRLLLPIFMDKVQNAKPSFLNKIFKKIPFYI